jgi:hypothetical protein
MTIPLKLELKTAVWSYWVLCLSESTGKEINYYSDEVIMIDRKKLYYYSTREVRKNMLGI